MAHGWNSSPKNKHEMIQIVKVLEVSIVERWAADAYKVHDTPKPLKQAIDRILSKV